MVGSSSGNKMTVPKKVASPTRRPSSRSPSTTARQRVQLENTVAASATCGDVVGHVWAGGGAKG